MTNRNAVRYALLAAPVMGHRLQRDERQPVCQSQRLAVPGDIVHVEVSGLDPDRDLRLYSTISRLDGLRYRPDADGDFAFDVDIIAGDTPGEHSFVVAQRATTEDEFPVVVWATVVAVREAEVDQGVLARVTEYLDED